jgi:hypothetical protein
MQYFPLLESSSRSTTSGVESSADGASSFATALYKQLHTGVTPEVPVQVAYTSAVHVPAVHVPVAHPDQSEDGDSDGPPALIMSSSEHDVPSDRYGDDDDSDDVWPHGSTLPIAKVYNKRAHNGQEVQHSPYAGSHRNHNQQV